MSNLNTDDHTCEKIEDGDNDDDILIINMMVKLVNMVTKLKKMIVQLGSSLCLSVHSAKLRGIDGGFLAKPANVNLDRLFVCFLFTSKHFICKCQSGYIVCLFSVYLETFYLFRFWPPGCVLDCLLGYLN